MRRYIPGLHSGQQDLVSNLDGLFLVRVERASYRWHPRNLSWHCASPSWSLPSIRSHFRLTSNTFPVL